MTAKTASTNWMTWPPSQAATTRVPETPEVPFYRPSTDLPLPFIWPHESVAQIHRYYRLDDRLICWLIVVIDQWMNDWLIGWLVGWLIDWLIDWLIGLFIDWLVGKLIDYFVFDLHIDWFMVDYLLACLIEWPIDLHVDWIPFARYRNKSNGLTVQTTSCVTK